MIQHSKPTLSAEDAQAVEACISSGLISRNKLCAKMEQDLIQYLGIKFARITNSGTSALVLALKALGIHSAKQEVLLPTYVCKSVVEAINDCGGTPVFYDNSKDWISDLLKIKDKISGNTAAIIVVHTMGIVLKDIKKIVDLNIPVIEDVCQAFGAELDGKKVGTFGTIGVFSFHATKCLTTGEGGAIIASDDDIITQINASYDTIPGIYSFTDLQASLGISQLSRYNGFLLRRKELGEKYFENLPEWATRSFKEIGGNSIFFRFLIKIPEPFDTIKEKFSNVGIAVRKGVDDLLHRSYGLSDKDFPNAVEVFNETISLPIYPNLNPDEFLHIVSKTNEILRFYENRDFR